MGIKNPDFCFWENKRVFLTGHTGFKGSWLSLLLNHLGAEVYGYSLNPPTNPSLYKLCRIDDFVRTTTGDIRDAQKLEFALDNACPDIVIHMAAQPLVRMSYLDPSYTFQVNIMGTINLFEAIRKIKSVRCLINVTSDKCYENKEWLWPYRENEALGGYDPYASSKACSEIVTAAYRNSFFNTNDFQKHKLAIATARAGNVIGGGDWASDRLIPDFIRAILNKEKIVVRNPNAIRPWQHVLEPLTGYLLLAERLYLDGPAFAQAWNFGPNDDDAKTVKWIVESLCSKWGGGASFDIDSKIHPHEATYLKLDFSKAKSCLAWHPRWHLEKTLNSIIEFTHSYSLNKNIKNICLNQINEFLNTIQ